MGKQGLQREMDSFFRETENEEFNIRRITKGDKQVQSNTEIVRPGRSSPRKKKPPRLYHMNYKDV
jgi:hypothetical protein